MSIHQPEQGNTIDLSASPDEEPIQEMYSDSGPLRDQDPIDPEVLSGDFGQMDVARLIIEALPAACQNCIHARVQANLLAWTVETRRADPSKIATVIMERAHCLL
jgi:hypothetical protein